MLLLYSIFYLSMPLKSLFFWPKLLKEGKDLFYDNKRTNGSSTDPTFWGDHVAYFTNEDIIWYLSSNTITNLQKIAASNSKYRIPFCVEL